MAPRGTIVHGVPVAPGYGEGRVFPYRGTVDLFRGAAGRGSADSRRERERFEKAVQAARRELRALARRLEQDYGLDESNILHAQFFMLDDPLFRAEVERAINGGLAADAAIVAAVEEIEARLRSKEDPYLRERAPDVRDVGARLLRQLLDRSTHPLAALPEAAVVVAEELLPSDTACLDRRHVAAIVTERGSELGHAAILARSIGVPAVVRATGVLDACRKGDHIAVDGVAGRVLIRPAGEPGRAYARSARAYRSSLEQVRAAEQGEVRTRDHQRVLLLANVGCLDDAERAAREGAEGVGLLRTELLAWGDRSLVSEEEQARAYEAIASVMTGRPLTIRILDLGPDKALPLEDDLPVGRSGVAERGIGFALRHPELLRAQLRAILRTAAKEVANVRVLLPMVSAVAQVTAVRRLLEEEAQRLGVRSLPPVGAMIESPGAVLLAGEIAAAADFIAIGSNDLLAGLLGRLPDEDGDSGADPFEPSLIRAIHHVVRAARAQGREVSLCGEMAGDSSFTELLLGLGLRVLSVNPWSLPEIRYNVRGIDAAEAERLAQRALAAASAEEVAQIVRAGLDPWRRLLAEALRR